MNKDENLLTRLQHINLAFHFEVEQQVNSMFLNFFGFNGTAGVWRIRALEDSGGWLERTTVEDMDIAVRAHLNGWKFIFLNDVKVNGTYIHILENNLKCIIDIVNLFRFSVNYRNHTKPIRSSNTDGIRVLCSSSSSAFPVSSLQRYVLSLTVILKE